MHFQHAGLHQREQSIEVLDGDHLCGASGRSRCAASSRSSRRRRASGRSTGPWSPRDSAPAPAAGRPHAAPSNPRPSVVVGEVLLGDADVDPVDAVGMGEAHVLRPPCRHGLARGACLARRRLRFLRARLVAPPPCAHRRLLRACRARPHSRTTSFAGLSSRTPLNAAWRTAVARPAAELRSRPPASARPSGRRGRALPRAELRRTAACRSRSGMQPLPQVRAIVGVAGADAARIGQLAVVVIADRSAPIAAALRSTANSRRPRIPARSSIWS